MAKGYTGHKDINGVYHKIINNIPEHKIYKEIFCGSSRIAKKLISAVPAGVKYYLNDLDRSVTDKLDCTGPDVFISNCNALKLLLELLTAGTDTFVFMDPPYLHSTRPNSTKLYKYEMTDKHHIEMLTSVLQLKCNVMIIHPKCPLYDKMLSSWRKVEVKIRYNKKTSIECLYMNYDPGILQTNIYLGDDCWDRQRIKRKAKSLIKKLAALPDQERRYLTDEIRKHFN